MQDETLRTWGDRNNPGGECMDSQDVEDKVICNRTLSVQVVGEVPGARPADVAVRVVVATQPLHSSRSRHLVSASPDSSPKRNAA